MVAVVQQLRDAPCCGQQADPLDLPPHVAMAPGRWSAPQAGKAAEGGVAIIELAGADTGDIGTLVSVRTPAAVMGAISWVLIVHRHGNEEHPVTMTQVNSALWQLLRQGKVKQVPAADGTAAASGHGSYSWVCAAQHS